MFRLPQLVAGCLLGMYPRQKTKDKHLKECILIIPKLTSRFTVNRRAVPINVIIVRRREAVPGHTRNACTRRLTGLPALEHAPGVNSRLIPCASTDRGRLSTYSTRRPSVAVRAHPAQRRLRPAERQGSAWTTSKERLKKMNGSGRGREGRQLDFLWLVLVTRKAQIRACDQTNDQ